MRQRHGDDMQLALAVTRRDATSWESFVRTYSGLIFSVIRRYLLKEDEDEHRNLYVRVLEQVYDGGLRDYDGSSSLATWVVTIARSRCLDYLRKHYGRRTPPRWLAGLPELDREVYGLYYLTGFGYTQIAEHFRARGRRFSPEDLVDTLHRLEASMSSATRKRLAYDLQARVNGQTSATLAEFVAEARRAAEERVEETSPERVLFEQERLENLERLRTYVQELDGEEREVLHLFYTENQTAERIRERLGLPDRRRVYTVATRAVRKLRARFAAIGLEGPE